MAMKEIPLLTAQDIECRVQSVSRAKTGKVGAVLLLYKDARVDMRILDMVFGASNWQRTHELINGNLFCTIEIWDEDKKTWVKKQDVGTESNTEKEKGQASDAFKRAGFNVGIGRELYTSPFIYVELNDGEYWSDKQGSKEIVKCNATTRFQVQHIDYNDRREINALVLVDRFGNVRYSMGGKAPAAPQRAQRSENNTPPAAPVQQNTSAPLCPICGKPISKAEQDFSMKKYGREACRACQKTL